MQEQTSPSMEQDTLDFEGAWGDAFEEESVPAQETTEAAQEETAQPEPTSEPAQAEQSEPEPTPDPAPEQEAPVSAPQEGLRVKYNGQERTLTPEEAVVFAQKGMNYDHVQQELTTLRTLRDNPGMRWLESVAKQNNMTLEQYLAQAQTMAEQQQRQQLETQGLSKEDADMVVRTRRESQELAQQRRQLEEQAQQQQAETARRQAFVEFFRAHPEVKPQELPQEVLQAAAKGADLETAYTRHANAQLVSEVAQLKAQIEQMQTQQKAKAQAVGSATSDGAAKPQIDEGWAAFESGY